jgi:2,4-diaminopentanoate dehydrogenase
MSHDSYRVIQWATGSVGQIGIRHFAATPGYELVGVYVTSEAKAGRDAGELAEMGPMGVVATTDIDEVLALDADCVHYAPLNADLDEMCRILRSGKSIVTPSGFTYPSALGQVVVDQLEEACRAGSSSLFGGGIHPGWGGELLPMTMARLCSRIDQVVVQEVADVAHHPSASMMFDNMGFGRDRDDLLADPSPMMRATGGIFEQTMTLLADGLAIPIDRFTTDIELAVAKRDLTVRVGTIARGSVAAFRYEWTTWSNDEPVIVLRSVYKMDDDLDPDWGLASNLTYTVEIHGEPSFTLNMAPSRKHPTGDEGYWGRIWTAMDAINAIPAVVQAAPGIHTHLDLPLVQPLNLHRPPGVEQRWT